MTRLNGPGSRGVRTRAASLAFGVFLAASVADSALAEQRLGSRGAQGSRWQRASVAIELEPSVEPLGQAGYDAIVAAASAWQEAAEFLPTLTVKHGSEGTLGYNREGGNRNILRYSPEAVPLAKGALAITVITFDAAAGRILDADILLNGQHAFDSFDDDVEPGSARAYDLQNVLTHEVGHLLGLGEEMNDERATMYAFSQPGETTKRELESADLLAIAQLYSEPMEEGLGGGCGAAAISNYRIGSWAWALLGLCGLSLWGRRRSAAARGAAWPLALVLATGASGEGYDSLAATAKAQLDHEQFVVSEVTSDWQGGLVVSTLTLSPENPSGHTLRVQALGGVVGDVGQRIGHALPPALGDAVRLDVAALEAYGAYRRMPVLSVTEQP